MVKLNKGVNALLFRLRPELFANTMEYLNVKQKPDIIELGFRALLNFKLNYIPPKLGFWLATYFKKERTDRCGDDGHGVQQRSILACLTMTIGPMAAAMMIEVSAV